MALISLVYVSLGTDNLTEADLRDILSKSRKNNRQHNITGMLLYRDGFFIQALEGEEEDVNALFDKIIGDKRHRNVVLVYKNAILMRTFGSWSMGFNKITDNDVIEIEGFTTFLEDPNAEFFTDQPSRAATLLDTFKNRTYF